MTAIFANTQQALHVSFLVMSQPVREKNGLRITLIKIIESIGTLNRRQAAFLDYLYGQSGGSVNFEGLTPLEVRGQCALVTATVEHHLKDLERFAIWVRYAKGIERKQGVLYIAARLRGELAVQNMDAVRLLVAEHALPRDQRNPEATLPAIAKETGVTVNALKYASTTIRKRMRAYENAAYDILTPMFERDGLVARNE